VTDVFDPIDPTRREVVAAALRATFGASAVQSLEPIAGGLSAALVYRLVVGDRPYLLRIVRQINPFNDPARHFACLKTAAEAGLAPAVHHADPARALLITDFITARPFALFQRPRAEMLADLAGAVRRLQATPPFPPFMSYLDGVDRMIADVKTTRLLPAAADEVLERYAAIPAAYPRDRADMVSSHNDMNPTNTMWDGQRLWIVDWEAAFLNDRYVDPAYICNNFVIQGHEEEAFLTACFGARPTEYQRARVFLMRQVCHMFFAAALLRMAAAARPGWQLPTSALSTPPLVELRRGGRMLELLKTPEGLAQAAVAALNEVLASTHSPPFAEALALVRP
jgi:aminoglycoside phosphotransferase (APT) family kinase protein